MFHIIDLTPALTRQYFSEMAAALNQIPSVEPHTLEMLLAETKGERVLHAKWQHSFIALDKNEKFAGVIIGYEREKEGNAQYPHHVIYLSDLAVAATHQRQGLGKQLVQHWLSTNRQRGFLKLTGPVRFAVQTNQEPWNAHVQKLYTSFGFQPVGTKQYDNRTDVIYLLESNNG